MYKILLIEDDETLRMYISQIISKYDYQVFTIDCFENILSQISEIKPDLILLDVNLPVYDGFYICRMLRKKSTIPIIIVSARGGGMDQVMGLESGADDYITKPVDIDVLLSKIKATLRRNYGEYSANKTLNLKIKGLLLDGTSFKLYYKNFCTELSKNEFKLIRKLMVNRNSFVSREELLEELWDEVAFVDDNTLSVNIKRLKSKFEEFGVSDLIKTKRGVGYMLDLNALEGYEDEDIF